MDQVRDVQGKLLEALYSGLALLIECLDAVAHLLERRAQGQEWLASRFEALHFHLSLSLAVAPTVYLLNELAALLEEVLDLVEIDLGGALRRFLPNQRQILGEETKV